MIFVLYIYRVIEYFVKRGFCRFIYTVSDKKLHPPPPPSECMMDDMDAIAAY